MIDIQTTVRLLNFSPRETPKNIKENCTHSLRIFLRAYKVSDMDRLMIIAHEYEELAKHTTGEPVLQDQVGVPNASHVQKMRRIRQTG